MVEGKEGPCGDYEGDIASEEGRVRARKWEGGKGGWCGYIQGDTTSGEGGVHVRKRERGRGMGDVETGRGGR